MSVGGAHHGLHLLGGGGGDDGRAVMIGAIPQRIGIDIGLAILLAVQHPLVADDGAEVLQRLLEGAAAELAGI